MLARRGFCPIVHDRRCRDRGPLVAEQRAAVSAQAELVGTSRLVVLIRNVVATDDLKRGGPPGLVELGGGNRSLRARRRIEMAIILDSVVFQVMGYEALRLRDTVLYWARLLPAAALASIYFTQPLRHERRNPAMS